MSPLHRLHATDLKNSGLSDETIKKACIATVPPDMIGKKIGFDIPGLCSCYEIPYDKKFSRFRVFYDEGVDGERAKYLQRSGTAARPYIVPEVEAVREKSNKEIWITEGEKKALKLLQHGELTISISGVWNFKAGQNSQAEDSDKYLWEELWSFNWAGRTTYLAFDADLWVNPHVRLALWELCLKLYAMQAVVHFVVWEGAEGKGIDDYLVSHEQKGKETKDVIAVLKKSAVGIHKFVNEEHADAIIRALNKVECLDPIRYERIVKRLAKSLGVSPKTLTIEINRRAEKSIGSEEITEDEKTSALQLLKSPVLISEYLRTCHSRYVGRDQLLILVKLAAISRVFRRGIPVFLSGTASVGKSELVTTVLSTVWPEDKEDFSRVSENYLLYRKAPLDHKVIIFFELKGTENSAHLIRSAITEGVLRLGSVVNDAKRGLVPMEIEKSTEGTVIITTFASGRIDHELSTRVIEAEITHDEEIARQVLEHKAGKVTDEDFIPFRIWQVADKLLEPAEVVVPFSQALAKVFPVSSERFMRDFDKVLYLIMASAYFHQHQRERDAEGRIKAAPQDYEVVYALRHIITETVSAISSPVLKFLKKAEELTEGEELSDRGKIAKALNCSDESVKRYVRHCLDAELIETQGRGQKQTIKVLSIPESVSPLPRPEILFASPAYPFTDSTESAEKKKEKRVDDHLPVNTDLSENNFNSAHQSIGKNGESDGCPTQSPDSVTTETNRSIGKLCNRKFSGRTLEVLE